MEMNSRLLEALRSIAALSVYPDDIIPEEHMDDEDRAQAADPLASRECQITYETIRAIREAIAVYNIQ